MYDRPRDEPYEKSVKILQYCDQQTVEPPLNKHQFFKRLSEKITFRYFLCGSLECVTKTCSKNSALSMES